MMKLTVKGLGTRYTFPDIDGSMLYDHFKAIVAAQFELESESFGLKLGSTLLEEMSGRDLLVLGQMGIISGDMLFMTQEQASVKAESSSTSSESAKCDTKNVESERSSTEMSSGDMELCALEGIKFIEQLDTKTVEEKIVAFCHWIMLQRGFVIQGNKLPNNLEDALHTGSLRLSYQHQRSFREPDIVITLYDTGTDRSCVDFRGSCINIMGERIFCRSTVIQPKLYKNHEGKIPAVGWSRLKGSLELTLIDDLVVMAVGYETLLLNVMSNPRMALRILGGLDVKSIGRLEQTCSAVYNNITRQESVWKLLLRRDFSEVAVTSAQTNHVSFRSAYESAYVERKKKKAQSISIPMEVDDPLRHIRPPYNPAVRQPVPPFPRGPPGIIGDPFDIDPFRQPRPVFPDPFPNLRPDFPRFPHGPRFDPSPRQFPGPGRNFPDKFF